MKSQPWSHRLSFVLLALFLIVFSSISTCLADKQTDAKINKLFEQWDKPDSPGAAIVVVKDASVVFLRGYGLADLENRVPITPQTVFDAASVAKQFTGLAVATLVADGKISLDDDVKKFLPQTPAFAKPIQVQHLVHHTSGLRDWPETLSFSGMSYENPITMQIILDMVSRQRELDFSPGEEYSYSNTGYNLLAEIVEKVSGRTFRAWTQERVFQPLQMSRTHVCDDPSELVSNRAASYAAAGKSRFRRAISQLAAPGSSSLFVSAEDLGKWLINFESATVGGKNVIDLMQQSGKLNKGTDLDYAFGVRVDRQRFADARVVLHSGSWAGYRSVTMWIPEKRFGVGILANLATIDPGGLAWKVTEIYCGLTQKQDQKGKKSRKTPPRETTAWDSSRFLGTYRLGPGWLLTITQEGEQFFTQATREAKFKMTPVSTGKFFVDGYDASIEFVRDGSDSGPAILYRGIKAPKLSLPDCGTNYLASFVGDYWSDELLMSYRLELHEGKLRTWHRTGGWVELLPSGTNRFDTDARSAIEFTRDIRSEVTGLRISGGRVRNLSFRKITLR